MRMSDRASIPQAWRTSWFATPRDQGEGFDRKERFSVLLFLKPLKSTRYSNTHLTVHIE
jgi:hypothetical protein